MSIFALIGEIFIYLIFFSFLLNEDQNVDNFGYRKKTGKSLYYNNTFFFIFFINCFFLLMVLVFLFLLICPVLNLFFSLNIQIKSNFLFLFVYLTNFLNFGFLFFYNKNYYKYVVINILEFFAFTLFLSFLLLYFNSFSMVFFLFFVFSLIILFSLLSSFKLNDNISFSRYNVNLNLDNSLIQKSFTKINK